MRQRAKTVVGQDRFLIVHLAAPIEDCRERDTEGHYQKADEGELANFPGVSAPYEEPSDPDLVLPTHELTVDQCVDRVMRLLEQRGVLR